MRVASYYKFPPDDHSHGKGMGNGWYWSKVIGEQLPSLLGDLTRIVRKPGRDSRDPFLYTVLDEDFDITYCQPFDIPRQRPRGFVYGFISDYLGLEPHLENWLDKVRPNVLFSLQHYRQDIIDRCSKYDCECILLPWFITEAAEYVAEKTLTAYISGTQGTVYSVRTLFARFLENMNQDDIVTRMTDHQGFYEQTAQEDQVNISRSKYVFSGGVLDFQIPPKYYDICNHGGCLVSPELPMMENCGFVDGQTYIKVQELADIRPILKTDRYREIGLAGQKMVQAYHTIDVRAKQILEIVEQISGT